MIGWAMLVAAGLAAAVTMWLLRFPRPLWMFGAAALMLGAAGYAWQGEPAMPGSPVERRAAGQPVDPQIVELREAFFGRFGPEAASFVASDGLRRGGATGSAVSVMLAAVRTNPASQGAWTGLADAIVAHDGGQALSPAARLAFDRAILIDPTQPGPWFFDGLAHIRTGDLDGARARWARAYSLIPEGRLKKAVALRLALLDQIIAMRDRAR